MLSRRQAPETRVALAHQPSARTFRRSQVIDLRFEICGVQEVLCGANARLRRGLAVTRLRASFRHDPILSLPLICIDR
jgi:hypothetical protein